MAYRLPVSFCFILNVTDAGFGDRTGMLGGMQVLSHSRSSFVLDFTFTFLFAFAFRRSYVGKVEWIMDGRCYAVKSVGVRCAALGIRAPGGV
ncbi:hypothetical protein BJ878DRAFT_492276 [Calycina marina]|uniref:Uncharacterized protein n=1 Tax=Calycina marina TaxID=1763456 RepID=A0A9P8CI68_9HELO|nr:hypothetical protein BJ878DRAFT_492276 [Calycina marina]